MTKSDNRARIDKKVILSTLWLFATLNYVYADVFTIFFDPSSLKETAKMGEGFALGAAVLMETAIAMVLLSRVLKYTANRWANIVLGAIQTLAVLGSLFVGVPLPFYVFFASIEIACTLFIVWYAWNWSSPEVIVNSIINDDPNLS